MDTRTSPAASAARLLERAVADGVVPGGVIAVGPEPVPHAAGSMAVAGEPMRADAIFRIQSMTKIVTAVAALRLVEEGSLALDSPVAPWLPELAAPRVLPRPGAPLEEATPARTPITVRHLLTNTSGVGMILEDSPLRRAMADARIEAGPLPPVLGADDWLSALSSLPLVGEPGTVWRYHHSFGLLGILLARLTGRSTGEHLQRTLFTPLGMDDTGCFVPAGSAHRIPASYAADGDALVEREPAGGGFHVGPPPYRLDHGELLSTAPDLLRFLSALRDGELLSPQLLAMLSTDQVPDVAKRPDSFFPGFWQHTGWGFGVSVVSDGPHRGRWGWSGGAGTDFFVDPDGTIGLLLTQVEMGERLAPLLGAYGELAGSAPRTPS